MVSLIVRFTPPTESTTPLPVWMTWAWLSVTAALVAIVTAGVVAEVDW